MFFQSVETIWLFGKLDVGAKNSASVDGIFITADVDVVHTAWVEPLDLEQFVVVQYAYVLKDLC